MNYTVKAGDTLRKLAMRYLGDEMKWRKIWLANRDHLRSKNPDKIYPGETLNIPDKEMTAPAKVAKAKDDPEQNEVTLYVNGKGYSGWVDAEITRSVEALAGAFSVSLTEKQSASDKPFPIFEGDQVVVKIGSDTVVTGYIDSAQVAIIAEDHTFSVSGRDKTGDLVDCSAAVRPGTYKDKSIVFIASDLCSPFGIDVVSEISSSTIAVFKVQPGESVSESLNRLIKEVGCLVRSDARGRVLFSQAGTTVIKGALVLGQNILEISVDASFSDRFSSYTVEGQDASASIQSVAKDSTIKRHRPLVIVADGDVKQGYVNKRATWEAATRAGKGKTVTITVSGWRDGNGDLWATNKLVEVDAAPARAKGRFLISQVQFKKNADSGTTTVLTLKAPEAFKPAIPTNVSDPSADAKYLKAGSKPVLIKDEWKTNEKG